MNTTVTGGKNPPPKQAKTLSLFIHLNQRKALGLRAHPSFAFIVTYHSLCTTGEVNSSYAGLTSDYQKVWQQVWSAFVNQTTCGSRVHHECFLIDGVLYKTLLPSARRPGGCIVIVPDETIVI